MSDELPSDSQSLTELDDEWCRHPALAAWLFQNPANERQFHQWREEIEQHNDWSGVPADMREDIQFALRKWRTRELLLIVDAKMKALADLLSDESLTMAERFQRSEVLISEVNDALLDTPEPHRSRFLRGFLTTCENIRNCRKNLG